MVKGEMCPFHWTLAFFGLPDDYRKTLHEEIFTLIYYGQGFTHDDVYSMPVYLRRFYSITLLNEKDREQKAIQKSRQSDSDPNKRIPFK